MSNFVKTDLLTQLIQIVEVCYKHGLVKTINPIFEKVAVQED